jgi:heme/copper-type cytochrome/quinol oxidase subunit 3
MQPDKRPFLKRNKAKKIFFVIAAILVFATVIGTLVMLLWNAILPNILNTRPIKLWEAIGLLAFFRLLTGSLRFAVRGRGTRHQKNNFREKWMTMTDEEKTEFKARWKARCGK